MAEPVVAISLQVVIICFLSQTASAAQFSKPPLVALAHPGDGTTSSPPHSDAAYAQARSVRVNEGHHAAVPLYRSIIVQNPNDHTAATRVAAASSSPLRHDSACALDDIAAIERLKSMLRESLYDRTHVGELFGLQIGADRDRDLPLGPTYLKPAIAGAWKAASPLLTEDGGDTRNDGGRMKSLKCLVVMFLLGLSVSRSILVKSLVGGPDTIQLLENLGLAFPCEVDPNLIVPHVHLFPMDVAIMLDSGEENNETFEMDSIILATDLHPTVLSRTTIGQDEDGAVMYIGPDSLALIQHQSPLRKHISTVSTSGHLRLGRRILDLCTGSGVQAIATLTALGKIDPAATAVCVDVNERALRFTRFNAMLNGHGGRVQAVKGDLIEGVPLNDRGDSSQSVSGEMASEKKSLVEVLLGNDGSQEQGQPFDIILSNPPFIPVPPTCGQDGDTDSAGAAAQMRKDESSASRRSIEKRYGLFSSGGSDGEEVLRAVVAMSPRLLRNEEGFVGIVSEFMNPSEDLCRKMESWWRGGETSSQTTSIGLLFTNEHPVPARTYASRRADDEAEFRIWADHLQRLNIASISPGLLFICREAKVLSSDPTNKRPGLALKHRLVPRSESGSLWTPHNGNAVEYVSLTWSEFIKMNEE